MSPTTSPTFPSPPPSGKPSRVTLTPGVCATFSGDWSHPIAVVDERGLRDQPAGNGRWLMESNLMKLDAENLTRCVDLTREEMRPLTLFRKALRRIPARDRNRFVAEYYLSCQGYGPANDARHQALRCCAGELPAIERYGLSSKTGRRCRQMRHCPVCSTWDRSAHLSRLLALARNQGLHLHFITLSIRNPIPGRYHQAARLLWYAQNEALKDLCVFGEIEGGVRRYEVAVSEFNLEHEAYLIRPHLHALVLSKSATLDEEFIRLALGRRILRVATWAEDKSSESMRKKPPAKRRIAAETQGVFLATISDVKVESLPADRAGRCFAYIRKTIGVLDAGGAYDRLATEIERSGKPLQERTREFRQLNALAADAMESLTIMQSRPDYFSPVYRTFGCMNAQRKPQVNA